jgi:hypothetical protein
VIMNSYSGSLWGIQSDAVSSPATTKPWLTATLVDNLGTPNEYLETFTTYMSAEFAASGS